MTTMENITKKCAYCGNESEQTVMMSTSYGGHPDLDLRSKSYGFDSIYLIVDQCPHCGYSNYDISDKIPNLNPEILKSQEFKDFVEKTKDYGSADSIGLYKFVGPQTYLIMAYLFESVRDYIHAGNCYLRATWIFDDENNDECAVKTRLKTVESFLKVPDVLDNLNFKFQIIDLLRRSSKFDESLEYIKSFEDLIKENNNQIDEIFAIISDFQKELIAKKDSSSYTVKDAIEFHKK